MNLKETGSSGPRPCNCAALREAARHVSQLYDHHLAVAGLRNTQFTILVELKRSGPISINALARNMVMDRTTLGRNILPLQRRRLIIARRSREDARSKELELTAAGAARLDAGIAAWSQAQAQFEARLGSARALELRQLLRAVTNCEFEVPTTHSGTGDEHE